MLVHSHYQNVSFNNAMNAIINGITLNMPNVPDMIKLAEARAATSLDPHKKVGIIGLDKNGNYVDFGINHAGHVVDNLFWNDRERRRKFMVHAEIDLLMKLNHSKEPPITQVFITLFPCEYCMVALAQAGVIEVHYLEIYDKDKGALEVAKHHGVGCHQYVRN